MADVVLSPREWTALATVSPTRRGDAFFARWVLKEAYVKAGGGGLSMALERISIDLGTDSRATVVVDGAPTETDRWGLRALDLDPGHVAALAVEGSDWRLICRRWRDADPADARPRPAPA
jgi:4'-phosphopantetheinyl transferase